MSTAIEKIYDAVNNNPHCVLTNTKDFDGFTIDVEVIHYNFKDIEVFLYEYENMLVLTFINQDEYSTHWHPFNEKIAIKDMHDIFKGKYLV